MGPDGRGCSRALGHSGLCKGWAEATRARRKKGLPPAPLLSLRPVPVQASLSQSSHRPSAGLSHPALSLRGPGLGGVPASSLLLPSPIQVLGSAKQVQDTEWPQKALQPPPPQGQHCHHGRCLQILPTRPAGGRVLQLLLPRQPRPFSEAALAQRHRLSQRELPPLGAAQEG